ncbi:MAG: DUF4835 family protein [Bacteroidales bacterium]|nr:DUF4835 family protein [Bacteroidales bacterium]
MKRVYFLFIVSLFSVQTLMAQEFNCKVQINTQQVQGFDQSVVTNLQQAMTEFINSRKWTSLNFQSEERIETTLLFTVTAISNDQFTGTFHWVLERPVFGSSYRSAVLNMIDKQIQFKYIPSQSLNFSPGTFSDNLTSLLAYYAYMMLGVEFDTFKQNGGSAFYQQAMSIVQSAQNAPQPGWKMREGDNNRYQFVQQLQNQAYEPLRVFLYDYYRKGMDVMYQNPEAGRKAILAALPNLKQVYDKRPGLYDLQLIVDALRNEIIQVFTPASMDEKNKVVDIMSEIDPANGNRYSDALLKN